MEWVGKRDKIRARVHLSDHSRAGSRVSRYTIVHSQLKASVNLALVRWPLKETPVSFPFKHRVDWNITRTEEIAIVHQNRIIESCLTHAKKCLEFQRGGSKFDRCSANFRFLHCVVPNISVLNWLDCLYFCKLMKED